MPNAEADALLHLDAVRSVNSALRVEKQIHLCVFASIGVRRARPTSMVDRGYFILFSSFSPQ